MKAIFTAPVAAAAAPRAIKAAVIKKDWERFKLEGGVLIVYPPREDGKESASMVTVYISEKRDG